MDLFQKVFFFGSLETWFLTLGDLAGVMDREHPEPDQVRDAEPVVQAEGRKGHGKV